MFSFDAKMYRAAQISTNFADKLALSDPDQSNPVTSCHCQSLSTDYISIFAIVRGISGPRWF